VCRAVSADGAAVYFVGGCVRDAVLGLPGADVDLATDADPEAVVRLAGAAGLKAVPTGIDHGTITVVSSGKGFEVTTFRRDVKTDGRRAEVVFSDDIREDALRRDFTLNALYATSKGRILDPLGGLDDCLARRIRFIEDPGQRIREDYLRILRFFRFHAWYADPDRGFDPDALDGISQNIDGLETLSAERVGAEMMRLLAAPDPAPAVAVMRQTGVLNAVLPGADDRFLAVCIHLEASIGLSPDPLLRLAVLGGDHVAKRLRLSRKASRALAQISSDAFGAATPGEIAYRSGTNMATSALLLRSAVAQVPVSEGDIGAIARGGQQVFPVKSGDLSPVFSGKALGEKLAELEKAWIASDFTLDQKALVALAVP
jgi:poly(A) polymerase/tRNA nucleotidyltransferase (CCA-adding enzyme)